MIKSKISQHGDERIGYSAMVHYWSTLGCFYSAMVHYWSTLGWFYSAMVHYWSTLGWFSTQVKGGTVGGSPVPKIFE